MEYTGSGNEVNGVPFTHPSTDPPAPALHPGTEADATGTMGQGVGFMLFTASNKIPPGSNSALVWLWQNSVSHFT